MVHKMRQFNLTLPEGDFLWFQGALSGLKGIRCPWHNLAQR